MTDSTTYNAGQLCTIQPVTFVAPEGSSFSHWNTASDDSGVSYDDSDSFPVYANTTLYAIWTEDA